MRRKRPGYHERNLIVILVAIAVVVNVVSHPDGRQYAVRLLEILFLGF